MNKILIAIPLIAIIAISSAFVFLSNQAPSNPGSTTMPSTSNTNPGATITPSPSSNNPAKSPSVGISTVKYKTVDFVDSQGIGTKAFSMLIPVNWQSSGDIKWVFDNPAMPAFGSFKAWNPNGAEEYNYFANQAFFSSNNPLILQTFPAGSHYFGALVHAPLGPVEALKEIAIPEYRGDVQDLVFVSDQMLPQLSNVITTGTDPFTGVVTSASGGKIRVEYKVNGVLMEEEMYCVIQSLDIPVQTLYGTVRNINWYMTYLESFRAAKGQLDSETKIFQTISFSAKTDQSWLNKYNQVVNYLIQKQIQQIQSLGQLSKIISQTSNEISDENYQAWQQTQNVNDRLAHDFSNNILGIETYNNPIDGGTVDLPSGYNYAWANSLGEYILSDSPSYNPNQESNLNWQQMTP
jgi:hypothetical protein